MNVPDDTVNEAEIEAWIRTLDDQRDRNLVMWMERALRAEKELSELNGKLLAALKKDAANAQETKRFRAETDPVSGQECKKPL